MRTDGPHRSLTPLGLRLLRHYRRSWLRPDALAGITVAAYLIPQGMAYAGVAGLEPVAGLRAIIGSLLVYAVFGSSRQLSVGPESTTALMTAVTIAPLAAGDPARYAVLAAALALLVGILHHPNWAMAAHHGDGRDRVVQHGQGDGHPLPMAQQQDPQPLDPNTSPTGRNRGEPVALKGARRVRREVRGNGPGAIPGPRPGPTQRFWPDTPG